MRLTRGIETRHGNKTKCRLALNRAKDINETTPIQGNN